MDKASTILENLTTLSPQLPVGYQRLSSDPLSVNKEIDLDSSLVHPDLPKPSCVMSVSDQPLVEKSVDLVSPPVVHSIPEVRNGHTAHVLLISLDSPESKSDPPIPADQESPSSIPVEHGGNHTVPPLSSFVVPFDWSHLIAFCLPSYVPF